MKILAINGSHRGNRGLCGHYIRLLFRGAEQAGADCECVELSRLSINRCLACGHCQQETSRFECVYENKDDVHAIFEKMRSADLLIYATPVYVFGMSGLLKTFLDRLYATGISNEFKATQSGLLFHSIDSELCSRPFVPLICCDNMEYESSASVVAYFNVFSKFMDASQRGLLIRNGGKFIQQPDADVVLRKKERIETAFIKAGYELASMGKIRASTQRGASQEVIPVPFFHWIKRIHSHALKTKFIEKASQVISGKAAN